MADMPSEFWGGWIAVVTATTLLALVWLVLSVYFAKDDSAEIAELAWDETLREGTAPAPLWWFWFILALLVVSVVYLLLYPGMGTFAGVLHWSQHHEIAASAEHYEARFGGVRARLAAADLAELRQDGAAMASAASIFANHCAACHGPQAQGQAQLFPSLRDDEWQWGGTADAVGQTITRGRQAVMPPLQAVLTDQGVVEATDYVLALASGRGDADDVAAGRTRYQQLCSACHGMDGAGNSLLGAPALNDSTWLYGGTRDAVAASIAHGRNGEMPAFGERLDAAQIRLLTAWLTR